MSTASILILLIIGFIWFTYRRIKEFPKFTIESAMARGDYEHALEVLDGVGANKLLTPLEHDTYVMKCYFMLGNHDAFVKQVKTIATTSYKHDKKAILERWYYHCIRCQHQEFADLFLDALHTCNQASYDVALLCYRVIFQHDHTMKDTLQQMINNQKEVTFYTALANYLLGVIYFEEHHLDQALHAYDAALCNFDAIHSDIFYKDAKAIIDTYGNSNYLHYQDQFDYDFKIKQVDMVETYRYKPQQKHRK